MRKILILFLIGAIVVVMLAAGALILLTPASPRGAEHLDYGQAIQIDDFAFSAEIVGQNVSLFFISHSSFFA